ncbi:MAG: HAD hydrolase-like protein, partial [Burkholderiaceae bacterium]
MPVRSEAAPAAGSAGGLNGSGIDAAILDLDGTLIDTIGDFLAALNRMLGELALPSVERAFIEHTVGKGSEHLIHSTLEQVGANATALYARAFERYQHHYAAVNGRYASVYPGVAEGLARLSGHGRPLACLTNK